MTQDHKIDHRIQKSEKFFSGDFLTASFWTKNVFFSAGLVFLADNVRRKLLHFHEKVAVRGSDDKNNFFPIRDEKLYLVQKVRGLNAFCGKLRCGWVGGVFIKKTAKIGKNVKI